MSDHQIVIRDGTENMDFARVTQMLSQAEWSVGIGIDEIRQGAAGAALVVGAFYDGVQVGYARAISDKTRFAYLSDVYVDCAFRHRGIAKQMLLHILHHESLQDVYQWLLKSEADDLYAQLGFKTVANPESWMEIRNLRPNR